MGVAEERDRHVVQLLEDLGVVTLKGCPETHEASLWRRELTGCPETRGGLMCFLLRRRTGHYFGGGS